MHLVPRLHARAVLIFKAIAATLVLSVVAGNPVFAEVIGTFDDTRAGGLASLTNGLLTTQLRAALSHNFPNTEVVGTPTLTPQFLSGVQTLIISDAIDFTQSITPLTSDEQTAMLNFVLAGGNVVLFADGYFSSVAEGMVAPFGLQIVGPNGLTDGGFVPVPSSSPITDGPFGIVTGFTTENGGVFTSLGVATAPILYAANQLPSVAVIAPDALGPGSGRVVAFGDANGFVDPSFFQNKTLFLNTMAYVVPEPSSMALAVIGATMAWFANRRRATQ